jgi:hypothetical protein
MHQRHSNQLFLKSIILILHLLATPILLYSQANDDLLIEKLKTKSVIYTIRINDETYKAKEFLSLANDNIASSKLIISRISEGSNTENFDKDLANIFINKSKIYASKSDSVCRIIDRYKDSLKINNGDIKKLTENQLINSLIKDSSDKKDTSKIEQPKK